MAQTRELIAATNLVRLRFQQEPELQALYVRTVADRPCPSCRTYRYRPFQDGVCVFYCETCLTTLAAAELAKTRDVLWAAFSSRAAPPLELAPEAVSSAALETAERLARGGHAAVYELYEYYLELSNLSGLCGYLGNEGRLPPGLAVDERIAVLLAWYDPERPQEERPPGAGGGGAAGDRQL